MGKFGNNVALLMYADSHVWGMYDDCTSNSTTAVVKTERRLRKLHNSGDYETACSQ